MNDNITAKQVLVVFLIAGFVFGSIFQLARWYENHPCKLSHIETQYEQPPTMVVGGGKNGGGFGVPLGNIKPVQVTVCDER
jgi:hypothetical protein